MSKIQNLYDKFMKNWEAFEYSESSITPEHYYNNTELYKDMVMVVSGERLYYFNLTPIAMNCFRYSFGGTVCDANQWRHYRVCLKSAIYNTNSDNSIFEVVKLKYL